MELVEDIVNPLVELSEEKAPDPTAKCWMTEVRELSYDIEDSVDETMAPPAPATRSGANRNRRCRRRRVGCAKIARLPRRMKWSTRINKAAQLWLDLVREAIDRRERYLLDHDSSDSTSVLEDDSSSTAFVFSAQGVSVDRSVAENPKMEHASGSSRRVSRRHRKQAKHRTPAREHSERQEMYQQHDDPSNSVGNDHPSNAEQQHELPSPTRYEEAFNLVGMDRDNDPRVQDIMERIKCGHNQNLEVLSIVGQGGIGKSTLAKQLYQELGGQFMSWAFVRASQKPNIRKVLWDVLAQIRRHRRPTRASSVQSLIDEIHGYLKDKRYFIVIDDLCQATIWDIVFSAFPQSNNRSRILITTEMEDVALECSGYQSACLLKLKSLGDADSTKLFMNIVFSSKLEQSDKVLDEVSYEITRRSGGLPLATTCVAGMARVLAIQQTQLGSWSDINNFLSTTLTSSGTKEMMNEILHLCYDNLPQHLKTCLLYLSMYPEGYIISKAASIRRWIAEGFICTASEKDTEEIAECYFNDLINRRLILPDRIKHIDGVISCTVHHMVLDMIKCKSEELNFTTVTDYPHITAGLSTKVRRLSLQLSSAKHVARPSTVAMPQIRSIAFFGLLECLPLVASHKFKLIRVLVLEIWGEQNGCTSLDFTRLCTLLHLRYVNITSDITVQLPHEMARLQHLETFLVDARVSSVPLDIIDLPRLSHLRIKHEIELPSGIGSIRSLHTLQYFDLAHNSEDNVQSLGELSNLQNLHLTCSKAGSESEEHLKRNLNALSTSVGKLGSLCSLTLAPGASGAARITLEGSTIVSCVPKFIKKLEMSAQICIFSRLPECMGRLCKLSVLKISIRELLRNDMDRLNDLPTLVVLTLHVGVARVGAVVIQSASFPALRYFKYRSSVLSMVFRAGAMPNLECLKLGFHAQRGTQYGRMLGGVEHLPHLKEITAEIAIASGASESDWRAAESAFRNTIEVSSQKWDAVSGRPRFPSVRVKLADSWVVPEEEGYEGGVTGMATTDRALVCENLPFPIDLLPAVISFTSPVDACRCSAVCTAFHAVASSDRVWNHFIPADYRSMLSRAVDPIDVGFASTKKELFMTLAEQHILIDEGNKSFWLDRTTGAKSYMLASKSLGITWGGTPQYWRRTASRDSRFEEVAELIDVCWLDIIATIDCRELSLNTTYTAYLVFGLRDRSYGLDSETQEARIIIAGEVSARHTVSFHARARSQRRMLGSSSHYWLQHHQWENEEDNKNEDDEEVEEEEEDNPLLGEDKEDDEDEDSEEEDDNDIDVVEDEKEDEDQDGKEEEGNDDMEVEDKDRENENDDEDGEEEEEDDDMEVKEDKDNENEETDTETEEEEQYNIELWDEDDGEEEESDDELEEEKNDSQNFHLPIDTARRIQGTPPDIGGSSVLSDSLDDEQENAVRYPRARPDGWMEVTMGDFYNGNLDDGTIEIRLMEHRTLNWKSGLIVEGVEIRPKFQRDKQAATS